GVGGGSPHGVQVADDRPLRGVWRGAPPQAGYEPADPGGVLQVRAAVDSREVRLFDRTNLHLERDDEDDGGGQGDGVGHHGGQAGAGGGHGGEDRVADQGERAGGDQGCALIVVDADAPGGAHVELGGEGGGYPGDG